MNNYLNPDHQFTSGVTRIYFSKLDKDLNVEWTTWLDDAYTDYVTWHDYMPTELVETNDGAFAFLHNSNSGGYILVKTMKFE